MTKTCPICKESFEALRRDKIFCSKKCLYKHRNDLVPRKTTRSRIKADILRSKHIPQNQLEVIYGTLLGDGCLVLQTNSFHRLSFCHCEKQRDYIALKRSILSSIFLDGDLSSSITTSGAIQYHAHSVSHKDLTNIRGIFYRQSKFISRRVLELLTPTSLLFWYIDDGSMIRASGNAIVLCTDSYTLPEHKAIKKWFWQKYRIECNIMPTRGGYYPDRQYYRIRFNKENTVKLLEIISKTEFFERTRQIMPYKFYPYY